jgi:protein TonB
MFEDSLVESSGRLRRHGRWTAAFSFVVQIVLVGLLVLLPLIHTQALPKARLIDILNPPSPPPARAPEHPPAERPRTNRQTSDLAHGIIIRAPREIPKKTALVRNEESVPPGPFGIAGDTPGGVPDGALYGIAPMTHETPSLPQLAMPAKVRVSSGVAEGLLMHQVKPQYPVLARQARIEGTVVLQATIGKDGTVQNLRLISGHPMLVQAALDAVRQWRYRPYYLNNQPVEVDTLITVNFTLATR